MTLFYDGDEHAIIENHPEYVEFDDKGRMIMHVDEMRGSRAYDKLRAMMDAAKMALKANDHEAEYTTTFVSEGELDGSSGK